MASYKSSEEQDDPVSPSSSSFVPYVNLTALSGIIGSVSDASLGWGGSIVVVLSPSHAPRNFNARKITMTMNPTNNTLLSGYDIVKR